MLAPPGQLETAATVWAMEPKAPAVAAADLGDVDVAEVGADRAGQLGHLLDDGQPGPRRRRLCLGPGDRELTSASRRRSPSACQARQSRAAAQLEARRRSSWASTSECALAAKGSWGMRMSTRSARSRGQARSGAGRPAPDPRPRVARSRRDGRGARPRCVRIRGRCSAREPSRTATCCPATTGWRFDVESGRRVGAAALSQPARAARPAVLRQRAPGRHRRVSVCPTTCH